MGNSQSSRTYAKLHGVMPPVNNYGGDNPLTGWLDKTTKPFVSEEDRKQFIYATITVITENGTIDLRDHDFRLLYSRRNSDRLVARLVAEKEGIIRTQVVADSDGKNQVEAFQALRKHVETQLDSILSGLPNASVAPGNNMPSSYEDGKTAPAGGASTAPTTTTRPPGSTSSPASASLGTARQSSMTSAGAESSGRNGQIALPNDAPPAYGKAVKEWRTDEKKT